MKLHEQHPHESTIVELNNVNYDTGVKETDLNINQNNISLEELLRGITDSGQYDHLRLILSKNNNRELGQKYLMVCRSGFQMVKLLDVNFEGNQICMALQDICTGMINRVQLDINDPAFRLILVSWQDIREILNSESFSSPVGDELLEFEF